MKVSRFWSNEAASQEYQGLLATTRNKEEGTKDSDSSTELSGGTWPQ